MFQRFLHNEHLILSVLAAAIGAAAGFGALAFRAAIGAVQAAGFGFSSEFVVTGVQGLPWWQILVVPTAGGLLVGLLLHYLVPGGRAHGVSHIIEAVSLRGGRMPFRQGLVSVLAAAVSIGAGASTGREGPVVHLGASLAAWLTQKLRLGPGFSRTLIGCGAASAVAASFNAPLAGVLFALEVIIGHHALKAFAPIVIASVTGTVIARARFGNSPAFAAPEGLTLSLWEFPAFVLLGIVSAIAAILLMRAILLAETVAGRSPIPSWAQPACAGLFVGALALLLPQVLGVGYEATGMALHADFALSLLLILICAKIAATAVSIGFGFAGGIFSPSLFIGALVGGAFGTVAGAVFPDLYSGSSAYALIGTGAVAGAVLGAPMSTILIIFELTGDDTMTIAVMVATVVASIITHRFFGRSFFHFQLKQRGINMAEVEDRDILHNMRVSDVMRSDFATVPPDFPGPELTHQIGTARHNVVVVVEASGALCGLLSYADIYRRSIRRSECPCARDLTAPDPVAAAVDDLLDLTLDRMRQAGLENLPVVSDLETMTVLGFLRERDILDAHNRAIRRARAREHGYD